MSGRHGGYDHRPCVVWPTVVGIVALAVVSGGYFLVGALWPLSCGLVGPLLWG